MYSLSADPMAIFESYRLEDSHLNEWIESGVAPEIVRLNVRTLVADTSSPYVERSFPIAEFLNWEVRLAAHRRERRLPPFDQGWACCGIDCNNGFERMTWGCFKPDQPSWDEEKGRHRKYEHPRRTGTRVFWLDVPWSCWKRVARRFDVPVSLSERRGGFWPWVIAHPELPIVLVEGAKKAGALLSRGYVAIALPGIYNGYRKDEILQFIRHLTPDLRLFAQPSRPVYICFDRDLKRETRRNVMIAATRTGLLFLQEGCEVHIIDLPGPQKGVDDLLVAPGGGEIFDALFASAETLERWEALNHWRLTYEPTMVVNRRYLGNVPYPRSGFCFVRSPKDTGKTTGLIRLVEQAISYGQRRVLVITNRIWLGRAICAKLGLEWVDEARGSDTARLLGFGLCIDSVHPMSQARFRAEEWEGAIVIVDEVEQTVWHALNSSTCREQRVSILQTLRSLCQVVTATGGLFIGLDADLSDLTVDFVLDYGTSEGGPRPEPWILFNEWQPERGWEITLYETPSPAPVLDQAFELLDHGRPVFFVLDSQKARSTWGSVNIETILLRRYPGLRVLRIDSETVADPTHPAYGCAERLNEIVRSYDAVISTPTIAAGVSIDKALDGTEPHFAAVCAIFQGCIPDNEARQFLARVRDYVPRFVWCRPFGVGKVGNGSQSYRKLLSSQQKYLRTNLAFLQEADLKLDERTEPVALRTWAKMAARINASLFAYRRSLHDGLQVEGHTVTIVSDAQIKQQITDLDQALGEALERGDGQAVATLANQLQDAAEQLQKSKELAETLGGAMAEVRVANQLAEALVVESAPDITDQEYRELQEKRTKSRVERTTEQKHFLQQRYGLPVSAELKLKDDEGWHPKIRLHYYLLHNPEYVRHRDRREWAAHIDRGGGIVCLQDLRLLTNQVAALQALGLPTLMPEEGREVRPDDRDVADLAERALRCRADVKIHLGLTIAPKMGPIQIVQALMEKLGMQLEYVKREEVPGQYMHNGKPRRRRVYRWTFPDDGRREVFSVWDARDTVALTQDGPPEQRQTLAARCSALCPPPNTKEDLSPPNLSTVAPRSA